MGLFSASVKCNSNVLLIGKTAIITGGNTGIGKETAKDFYKRGARVIIACRNLDRANKAIEDIRNECEPKHTPGTLIAKHLDLNNLSTVRQCANGLLKTEQRIDLLINNAGILCAPDRWTEDRIESHFGVNHLGHFLFTLLLLPRIIESAPARIVNVSSIAYEKGVIDFDDLNFERKSYSHLKAYAQSKLANILFTRELAQRLKNIQGVNVYSLHPGVITTELGRNINLVFPGLRWIWRIFFKWATKTPEQGAQTTIYCSVDEKTANETGLYYSDCEKTTLKPNAMDEQVSRKLWDVSVGLTGLENYDPFSIKKN